MNKPPLFTFVALLFGSLPFAQAAKETLIELNDKAFYYQGRKVDQITVDRATTVRFNNAEADAHALFSLSRTKKFELGVMQQHDQQHITLKKSGVVEVECAIHPDMKIRIQVQ